MYHREGNKLAIDVGSVKTKQELHQLLYEAFQFPDYYGGNWDAFYECIQDVEVTGIIEINNFKALSLILPKEAKFMSKCLEDYLKYRKPWVEVTIHIS